MSAAYTTFLSQFGDKLVNPSSDRSTVTPSDALDGKEIVMLYFSAHWCPPCRKFTPKLINLYKKLKDDSKSVELVFCSLDNSETEYNEYTSDMPWLCMPFGAKESKTMASKYKAEGIPHLVIIDGTNGEVITYGGTSEVREDPNGEKFPWLPKTLSEIWSNDIKILANNKAEEATLDYSSLKDKYLMLYFSAHWCPPCRQFTPILSKAYTKLKSEHDDFELVFISSDRDEDSFKEYFKEMTFCALPHKYRETKSDLSKTYEVRGIPKLIMLGPVSDDETGKREIINDDLNGIIRNGDFSDFPFYPKNYGSVDEMKDPNKTKVLIVLHEGGDDDEQKDTRDAVREVAEKLKDDADKDGMQYLWSFSTEGMGARVRQFLKLPEAGIDPAMVIMDLPDDGGYYKCDSKEITVESIMKFVENPGDRHQVG